MANFKSRCMTAMFASAMFISNVATAINCTDLLTIVTSYLKVPAALQIQTPTKGQAAFVAAVAMWIHLRTRGTDYDYQLSDWRHDLDLLMNSYNVFDPAARATIVQLFNKWMVGRKLTLKERTKRTRLEDGTIETIKDKKITSTGFGVMGLFDAYVIQQLEEVLKSETNLVKFLALYAAVGLGLKLTADEALKNIDVQVIINSGN